MQAARAEAQARFAAEGEKRPRPNAGRFALASAGRIALIFARPRLFSSRKISP
jgi:hypothetical protein